MNGSLDDLLNALPDADLLGQWERLSEDLGAKILELQEKKDKFDALIAGIKPLLTKGVPPVKNENHIENDVDPVAQAATASLPPEGRVRKGAWMTAIHQIAKDHPGGISYEAAKALLPTALQEQLSRGNTKAFYGSLRRLERDKELVRFNSHIFTPEGFVEFEKSPNYASLSKKGSPNRGSPIGNAVKEFIAENGPSKALAIKEHLCRTPEFRKPLMRNSSALYNVLKRLVDRGELNHDKERSTYSIVHENEAPNDQVAGASEAGEAPTSPNDAQSTLRLIG